MVQQERHFSIWMPTYIALSIMGFLIIALSVMDQGRAKSSLSDDGLIQSLTAWVLIAGCLMCLQRALRKVPPVYKWAELCFLLLIYAMREMDFHRLFTEEHLSKADFYLGPYPLHQKLIGGAIVLLAIIALLHFVLSNARFFFEQLKAKQSWAMHVIVWAVLLFGSQILDKSRWRMAFMELVVEETMELAAAIVILLIVARYPIELSPIAQDAQPAVDENA